MKKLSTGDDATLGNYRKLSLMVFGRGSKALDWLDVRIAEDGEDSEVIAPEKQVLILLGKIHEENQET